ncbi:hypothetical protein [Streptomyces neyagawaensis]|uniref:Uncharacterized protein n=1 Tax=Streptomyces neyagawaensis TaxID=42238 RepID=A0ABV3BAM8_9ACTN
MNQLLRWGRADRPGITPTIGEVLSHGTPTAPSPADAAAPREEGR